MCMEKKHAFEIKRNWCASASNIIQSGMSIIEIKSTFWASFLQYPRNRRSVHQQKCRSSRCSTVACAIPLPKDFSDTDKNAKYFEKTKKIQKPKKTSKKPKKPKNQCFSDYAWVGSPELVFLVFLVFPMFFWFLVFFWFFRGFLCVLFLCCFCLECPTPVGRGCSLVTVFVGLCNPSVCFGRPWEGDKSIKHRINLSGS